MKGWMGSMAEVKYEGLGVGMMKAKYERGEV
jgi:hypothetical protein